jgi:hypothetical protein
LTFITQDFIRRKKGALLKLPSLSADPGPAILQLGYFGQITELPLVKGNVLTTNMMPQGENLTKCRYNENIVY